MFIVEAIIFTVILVGDLISKFYIKAFLLGEPGENFVLIENILELQYHENTGASFGIFAGKTNMLIVFTAISMFLVFLYLIFMCRKEPKIFRYSIAMILAGGVGNLVDRIAFGYVRDFIYFVPIDFPIFNVADSFVVIGVVLIVVYLLMTIIKEVKLNKLNKQKQGKE